MANTKLDELKARQATELRLAELEDALAEAKGTPKVCDTCGHTRYAAPSKKLREVKEELRAVRQAQREAEGR